MMKLPGILFCAVLPLLPLHAFEDLGPLDKAKQTYPHLFIPGSVNTVSIRSREYFVSAGTAEQSFSGKYAESESELYEEAALDAQYALFEKLSGGDKSRSVGMSGSFVLYRFRSGKLFTVLLAVPKDAVSVSAPAQTSIPSAPVNPPVASSPAADAPVSAPSVPPQPANAAEPSAMERRIAKYRSRIQTNPDDLYANLRLGELYRSAGKAEKARKFFLRALELSKDAPFMDPAEKIRLILNTAELCEARGYDNLAIKCYYYLLRHDCSPEQKQLATKKISEIRLRMI